MNYFVGIDTSSKEHVFCCVNRKGKITDRGSFPNTTAGFESFRKKFAKRSVLFGIETRNGISSPLDRFLLSKDAVLHQISPAAVKSYRENVLEVDDKTDDSDSYALAMLLRDAGKQYQKVTDHRPALKRLSRHLIRLKRDRTRLINRLRRSIGAYWPEAMQSDTFYRMDLDYVLHIFSHCPDPCDISKMSINEFTSFVRQGSKRVRKTTIASIHKLAAENSFSPSDRTLLVFEAKHLVAELQLTLKQIEEAQALMQQYASGDNACLLLESIDGASILNAAAFMAEIGDISNFATDARLASYAGLAAKKSQSGSSKGIYIKNHRHNRYLKDCILKMAWNIQQNDPESRLYYLRKINQGLPHYKALKALARHIIRMIFYMLKNNQPYCRPLRISKLKKKLSQNRNFKPLLKEDTRYANMLASLNL